MSGIATLAGAWRVVGDVDRAGDLSANPADFQRERNETFFANMIWDFNQSFRIGFEATYRETDNTSALDNEGAGFHTQFRWNF